MDSGLVEFTTQLLDGSHLREPRFVERTAYCCLRATGEVDVSAVGQLVAWAELTRDRWRTDRAYRQTTIIAVCTHAADRWWTDGVETVTGEPVERADYLTGMDATQRFFAIHTSTHIYSSVPRSR